MIIVGSTAPGFTAEASLYKTSGRYQAVATQGYGNGDQSVISQLRIDPFGGAAPVVLVFSEVGSAGFFVR